MVGSNQNRNITFPTLIFENQFNLEEKCIGEKCQELRAIFLNGIVYRVFHFEKVIQDGTQQPFRNL